MERTETTRAHVDESLPLTGPNKYQACDRQINPCYNWQIFTGWKRSLEFEVLMKLLKIALYVMNSFIFTLAFNNAGTVEVQIVLRNLNTLCAIALVFPFLGVFAAFFMAWKNKQLWPFIIWTITHIVVVGTSIAFAIYYAKISPTLRREIKASYSATPLIGTGLRHQGLEVTLCDVTNILNIVFPIVDFFIWCSWYCWFRVLFSSTTLQTTEDADNSSDNYRNHIIITNMKL